MLTRRQQPFPPRQRRCNPRRCNPRRCNPRLCNPQLCNPQLCSPQLCNLRRCSLQLWFPCCADCYRCSCAPTECSAAVAATPDRGRDTRRQHQRGKRRDARAPTSTRADAREGKGLTSAEVAKRSVANSKQLLAKERAITQRLRRSTRPRRVTCPV